MYLNDFSVRVPEGTETPGGYVEISHGENFAVILGNKRSQRCTAKLEINGADCGTFIIDPHSSIRVERPVHDHGKFTFYKEGSKEAKVVGKGASDPNRGLIRAVFTPETEPRQIHPIYVNYYHRPIDLQKWDYGNTCTTTVTCGEGATYTISNYSQTNTVANCPPPTGTISGHVGLSGHSGQSFYEVPSFSLDYSQQTVIHLRLVCRDDTGPRPLTSYSTPVPPPPPVEDQENQVHSLLSSVDGENKEEKIKKIEDLLSEIKSKLKL